MISRVLHQGYVPSLIVLVLLLASPLGRAADLEQQIQDEYRGKVLVMRGFYSGDHLAYDASGLAMGYPAMGDWTTDGLVLVDKIRIADGSVKISAGRLLVFNGKNGLQFDGGGKKNKKPKKWSSVEIQTALPSENPSLEQLEMLFSKIFLTSQDSMADLVPEYWNPCIREALNGKNADCMFSAELAAVPGISARTSLSQPASSQASLPQASSSQSAASSEPEWRSTSSPAGPEANLTGPSSDGTYRVGHGVSPPRQFYTPEPRFTEVARQTKHEGIVTLSLVVSAEGRPTKVRISGPLGCGLDLSAVQAVSTWRFSPAMKDGKPVAVHIQVEVDFHLY